MNKKTKIFNDPVLGFISISDPLILELIEHPYFQRLRRISQTGLINGVYPGATHTRFLHALGAFHLMQIALQTLKNKGIKITLEEERAACIAILLHDIGHGPFSHALEYSLLKNIHHEKLSVFFMELLNQEFNGELTLAIDIFHNRYFRSFFHELLSSQLDLDRLDYLKRDSFYTGVSEGNINSERIISMMNVVEEQLVIESKGIYSIERYLTARVFMYWQVYFHKTSLAAESYLIQAVKRARELVFQNINIPMGNNLNYFFNKNVNEELTAEDIIKFSTLDDTDLLFSLKTWQDHPDKILSTLCQSIIQRKYPISSFISKALSVDEIKNLREEWEHKHRIKNGSQYFIQHGEISLEAYNCKGKPIKLLLKDNTILKLQDIENQVLIRDLSKKNTRYYLCRPR